MPGSRRQSKKLSIRLPPAFKIRLYALVPGARSIDGLSFQMRGKSGLRSFAVPVVAADLSTPADPLPPPPASFYLHAGALGVFPQTNAQPTGGGLFTAGNVIIRPVYTVALEAGYFITPNITIILSSGVPPIAHIKATGFPLAGALGTNLLGSVRYDSVALLIQYHFTQFGTIQPYAGVGAGYVFSLGNISDGVLTNFSVDQNFATMLKAGTDLMLTPNWGVFVEGRKVFFSTDAQGFVGN